MVGRRFVSKNQQLHRAQYEQKSVRANAQKEPYRLAVDGVLGVADGSYMQDMQMQFDQR